MHYFITYVNTGLAGKSEKETLTLQMIAICLNDMAIAAFISVAAGMAFGHTVCQPLSVIKIKLKINMGMFPDTKLTVYD